MLPAAEREPGIAMPFGCAGQASEDATVGRIKADDAARLITVTLLAAFTPPQAAATHERWSGNLQDTVPLALGLQTSRFSLALGSGCGLRSGGRDTSAAHQRPRTAHLSGEPVSLTTHRLDQLDAELGAEPPNADVHDV
jgi:hypothetical protein